MRTRHHAGVLESMSPAPTGSQLLVVMGKNKINIDIV